MFRRDDPAFVVFGVLTLEDRDLRELPLIERKKILSRLIPKRSSFILFADHIERRDVIFIDSSAPATSSRGRRSSSVMFGPMRPRVPIAICKTYTALAKFTAGAHLTKTSIVGSAYRYLFRPIGSIFAARKSHQRPVRRIHGTRC